MQMVQAAEASPNATADPLLAVGLLGEIKGTLLTAFLVLCALIRTSRP